MKTKGSAEARLKSSALCLIIQFTKDCDLDIFVLILERKEAFWLDFNFDLQFYGFAALGDLFSSKIPHWGKNITVLMVSRCLS